MRSSGQFQACLFFFTKRFRAHKNIHKQTLTNKTELSQHQTTKATISRAHKFLRKLKSFVLRFGAFCARKIFSEKKTDLKLS